MWNKSIKKIGLICLGIASLSLVGCFHVPDEDWLPNRNKVETTQKDNQVEQALNSFMDGIDMVSSWQNEKKSDELNQMEVSEDEVPIDTENESIDDENLNQEITTAEG